MAKKPQAKTTAGNRSRVKVKDISKQNKELSAKDMKKVKGGLSRSQSDAQKSVAQNYDA
jgi:hypothetical protein